MVPNAHVETAIPFHSIKQIVSWHYALCQRTSRLLIKQSTNFDHALFDVDAIKVVHHRSVLTSHWN